MSTEEKVKSKLIQLLKSEVIFAYVFGSVAMGRMQRASDIDIAVYLKDSLIGLDEKLAFIGMLTSALGRDVDVIFLNDADIIITMQILTNGELIINNDSSKHTLFVAKKLGIYADFKISRQIIEQNMLSGRIYA